MIETICSDVVFHKLMKEMEKQFDFSKDYYLGDHWLTYSSINGFSIVVNKYTDEDVVSDRDHITKTIYVNGIFTNRERVTEITVTPKAIAVIVMTDKFVSIYDKSLYKWVTKLINKYKLDKDGKYKIIKCW